MRRGWIITLIIGALFTSACYQSNFFMFKLVDYLDDVTRGTFALRTARNFVMGVVDDLNPLKGKIWNSSYEIPTVNLTLTRQDLDHFDNVVKEAQRSSPYAYYMPNEINKPINSSLKINGDEYKIEIKLHGTNNPHFKNSKRSFSIKMRNKEGKQYPFGLRRFALIIPSQSNLVGQFTYEVADLFGMITPENFLVRVTINGIDQGIYHLEEKLNKVLLERNGRAGYDIVRSDDSWAHQYANNHGTMFSFDYAGLNPKLISGRDLNQLYFFKKILNSTEYEFLEKHVNLSEFVKYDVLRYIFGDSAHMTSHDNIKFLYSTFSGRLEPFFRIENHIESITSNQLTFSPEQHINVGMFTTNTLFKTLTLDNEYRALRNKALYNALQKQEEIIQLFDDLMEEQLDVLLNDTTNEIPSRYFKYEAERARENLLHNFAFLEKYLDYGRVFVEIVKVGPSEHEIVINADSNAPIGAGRFTITLDQEHIGKKVSITDTKTGLTRQFDVVGGENGYGVVDCTPFFALHEFSLSLDKDFEPKKNPHMFLFEVAGDIVALDVKFENQLSQRVLLERDTYISLVDEWSLVAETVPTAFKRIGPRDLVIGPGVFRLSDDIVLPYAHNLAINAGTTINLDPGISVLLSGNLNVNGTSDKPVIIRATRPDRPFGVFGIVGDKSTVVEIMHLDISGGSEDTINGKYLSGALSAYNHKFVSIMNSRVHRNHADDGLNVKNSDFLIKNNKFFANMADQVDLDSGFGIVMENYFSRLPLDDSPPLIGVDDNGDGLDLSDAEAFIIRNKVDFFLDKGFSIGENTTALAHSNMFVGNRSALTAKDSSKVYVLANQFIENDIDFELYQKKQFFSPPSIYSLDFPALKYKIVKTKASQFFRTETRLNIEDHIGERSFFSAVEGNNWVEYE